MDPDLLLDSKTMDQLAQMGEAAHKARRLEMRQNLMVAHTADAQALMADLEDRAPVTRQDQAEAFAAVAEAMGNHEAAEKIRLAELAQKILRETRGE